MENWHTLKAAFKPDGALRDIYISPADESLWNEFISLIHRGQYRHAFWHGQPGAQLPQEFAGIRHLQQTEATILNLFLPTGVQVNCHFFIEDEIEMDIAPREIADAEAFESLLSFLKWLAINLKRDVRLTYENSPDDEILTVHECKQARERLTATLK